MKALISPNEPRELGYRIAEVEPDVKVFDVAPPLFWVDCPNECLPDQWFYNAETQLCEPVPPEPEGEPITPVETLP
jgi:hypothetical protein